MWARVLRAALEVLVEVKTAHDITQCILEDVTLSSDVLVGSLVKEDLPAPPIRSPDIMQKLPVKEGNIFLANPNNKLPLSFVRSAPSSPLSSPGGNKPTFQPPEWVSSKLGRFGSNEGLPVVSWLFGECMEIQSTSVLPNLRLAILAVQGNSSVYTSDSH